jgi:serine protease Do
MIRFARLLAILTALGSLLAFGHTPRLAAEPADIAAAARSVVRVVLIEQDGEQLELVGHGSGVAIGPDLILTNAHVVAEAREDDFLRIGVVPSAGKTGWFARIVAFSPGNDLALIKLTEAGALPAATLYTGPVADGADVHAVGYPGNVDLAQGFSIGDIISPSVPVKTRGSISAGRSSKQFDTLLHTAPIGAGNSGGPLLDNCGRVIGINSFGTVSQDADSAFYFAASMREVTRFLLAAHVKAPTTGAPCRSLADLSRDEADRAAGEKERAFEAARVAADAADKAQEEAQIQVISERENGMAIAGLALLLALATGGAGVLLLQKERQRDAIIAAVLTVGLLAGAIAAWLTRPPLSDIGARADAALAKAGASDPQRPQAKALAGNLVCVLDIRRSRVTVSSSADVSLNWRADGCADGGSQFANGPDGWFRVFVPSNDETVTVASFDPASGVYRTDRYLLDFDAMARLRADHSKTPPLACNTRPETTATANPGQLTLKSMLPAQPNERLVYSCAPAGP